MFVRPVVRMDQEAWTRAHVEAFAFFGGVPARLVSLGPRRDQTLGPPGAPAPAALFGAAAKTPVAK